VGVKNYRYDKAEGRGQRAEGRGQKAEGRRQKAEGRRQRAEGRRQKAVLMKKFFSPSRMKTPLPYPATPLHLTPIFKLVPHERLYTTNHENTSTAAPTPKLSTINHQLSTNNYQLTTNN